MTPDITPESTVAKPKKDEHAIRISPYYTRLAKTLSKQQETAFAEVLTKAFEIGMDTLIERANRANIWRKTSLKSEISLLIDSLSEEDMAAAIALLEGVRDGAPKVEGNEDDGEVEDNEDDGEEDEDEEQEE
jgi:hypothetical protein